jgi:hypothetical protein
MFPRQPSDPESKGRHRPDEAQRVRSARLRRRVIWSGLAVLAVAIAFGCWLSIRAFEAKSSLEDARHSAQQAKEALMRGHAQEAVQWADDARTKAQSARDATHSLPWELIATVPTLGSPFKTGQQISDVVLGLTTQVLQPATSVGAIISPDRLIQGGRLDVQLLRQQEPAISRISADAARLDDDARKISQPQYLSAVGHARTQLQRQVSDVARLFANTELAARLAPAMMGADGTRTYFMGFQTNAEARGTGGLLGAFGILRFDDGTPSVASLASDTDLHGPFAPIDMGSDYERQYGFSNPTTDVRNSNQSSHFPYAAQIWKSLWEQESASSVDGVVSVDPVALSYILDAVGPVSIPDGEVVTKDNVVALTESAAYSRFPTDQAARKKFLRDIAEAVVNKTASGIQSPRQFLDALGRAVAERRIAVWSSAPAEQELLETTPLAHTIPDDPAPYAEVVVNNLGGNKLDYYLKRDIHYSADGCGGKTRNSTVTIRLTNTAPIDSLPDYVAGMAGVLPDVPIDVPTGTMLSSVRLLATKGAQLVSATADGNRVPVFTNNERGHPSFEVQVAIPPGRSGELTFHLSEPTFSGSARVPIQPLVDTVIPDVSVPECSG